jgi:mono/diheme cytochrome c family protein
MTRHERELIGTVIASLAVATLGLAGCDRAVAEEEPKAEALWPAASASVPETGGEARATTKYSPEQVERGRQLVSFGGCNDCHTPWKLDSELGAPAPDMTRMLSGHPEGAPDPRGTLGEGDMAVIGPTFTSFRMPFGVIYAPNLTPDMDTGTGSWTEDMFVGIFRKARHLSGDGRPVLPPMPWPSVASLPDADLVAIYAFLRSIPPVRNSVPVLHLPPPVEKAIADGNAKLLECLPRDEGQ